MGASAPIHVNSCDCWRRFISDEENVVLTREELYEEVWSEPMATVAGKYGLSDVGLAKICRKLDVPVPWRGYWRKKQVGQTVKRPPLPKLSVSATRACAR